MRQHKVREVGLSHSTGETGEQDALRVAEPVEERAETKRNANEHVWDWTQSQGSPMSRLVRVREVARLDRKTQFTALMHHVTPDLLKQSFFELKRSAASGIDGVNWQDYQDDLETNISVLHRRLKNGSYQPKPARTVRIPKADGSERQLSLQCIEDKLVQQAVVTVLNTIYEEVFLGFSYGFRPGRSQHQALDALAYGITKRKVDWVLDLDIQQFFDTVEHDWLIHMIQHRIRDRRLVDLIIKWIRVGVLDEQGIRHPAERGIPQGAVISPLLANIYLHYVFDLWTHRWRKRTANEVLTIRYADDALVCFQRKTDAVTYWEELKDRLGRFGLTLHPQKTRLVRFGRFAAENRARSGEGKPETFDFLGFTHYCGIRRNGEFKLGRITSRKRLARQIKQVQRELRRRMHRPPLETLSWLRQVIQGHFNYFAVPGNGRALSSYKWALVTRWLKMLKRRSQRKRIDARRFHQWAYQQLPKVRIVHPYPEQRFCAIHSK